MSGPAPEGLAILEELRADCTGVCWLDIDKMLAFFGFEREDLDAGQAFYRVRRYHPRHADLYLVYPPVERLPYYLPQRAIRLVETLLSREAR